MFYDPFDSLAECFWKWRRKQRGEREIWRGSTSQLSSRDIHICCTYLTWSHIRTLYTSANVYSFAMTLLTLTVHYYDTHRSTWKLFFFFILFHAKKNCANCITVPLTILLCFFVIFMQNYSTLILYRQLIYDISTTTLTERTTSTPSIVHSTVYAHHSSWLLLSNKNEHKKKFFFFLFVYARDCTL